MPDIIVRVKNKTQLLTALSFEKVRTVIADYGCAQTDPALLKKETPEKKIYLQLPDVLREKRAGSVRQIAERGALFDGIVIKNLDEIGLLKEMSRLGGPLDLEEKTIVGDAFLYAPNVAALSFYRSLFPTMKFILNDELSDKECAMLIQEAEAKGAAFPSDFIYKAYGYQPLMITNQCLNRNYAGCMKPLMEFADEKKNRFLITSECGQCMDIVYNGHPTFMLDKVFENETGFRAGAFSFSNLLLDFTVETEEEMRTVLSGNGQIPFKMTRGHHYKEIE